MAIIHLIKALSNFVENVENPNYSIVSVAQAEKYLKKQASDEKVVEDKDVKDEDVIEEVIEVEEDDQVEGTDELIESIDNFEDQEEEDVDDLIDSMSEEREETQVEATEEAVDELEEAIDDFEKPVTETPDSTFWDGLKSALDENPNVAPKDYDGSQDSTSTIEVLEDPEAVEDLSDLTKDETKIAVQAYNYFMKQGQDKSFEDEDFDGEIIDEVISEDGETFDSNVEDLDDSAIEKLVDGLDFDSPTFIEPSTSIDLDSKGDDTDIDELLGSDYLEGVEPETTIDLNSINKINEEIQ